MSKSKAKADSSMEDVLASIKQIIADDLDGAVDDEILDLTEELNTDTKETAIASKESKVPEKNVKQPAIESSIMDVPHPVDGVNANDDFSKSIESQVESLISQDAMDISTAALRELDAYTANVKTSITDNTFGQKTVEDVMKEMLRPLLKEWLDAHLPSLVKWLVTEQIEKMLQSKKV